jgi:hypothetical protein
MTTENTDDLTSSVFGASASINELAHEEAFGDGSLFWDWPRRWQCRAAAIAAIAIITAAFGIISVAAADLTVCAAATFFFFAAYAAGRTGYRGWLWVPDLRSSLILTYGCFGITLSVLVAILNL